jgi:hypothetical protein
MDTTYRFRFLIYVAAFMLVMSLCFVYAEPLPSRNPLLLQLAPQHAGFLAPSAQPAFDPSALRAAAPVVSPQALEQLEGATHSRRGFFHRTKHATRPVQVPLSAANARSSASALDLTSASPAAAASTR